MRAVFYRVWQCSWGALQTLVGFVLFLLHRKDRHFTFHGAIVTEWSSKASISLGMFVFVTNDPLFYYGHLRDRYTAEEFGNMLLVHEYVHTIQSLVLGPFYLLLVGISSLLWSYLPHYEKMRKSGMSYFSFWPEKWANLWGEAVTKLPSPGEV